MQSVLVVPFNSKRLNLSIAVLRLSFQILIFAMINMHYLSPYSYIRLGRLCYFYVILTSPLGNTVSKIVQAPRQSFIHFAFSFTDMYYSRSKHLIMCT